MRPIDPHAGTAGTAEGRGRTGAKIESHVAARYGAASNVPNDHTVGDISCRADDETRRNCALARVDDVDRVGGATREWDEQQQPWQEQTKAKEQLASSAIGY
jgi:hypothetical protein